MKLSTLKKLIKEEINRTLKEEAGSVSVSPDASGSDYQHLISLFNGIVSKNEDLNGVRGFIDLGKNVDAYMDTLAYLSDEDAEEMKEEPVLVMKKGPYEIIFDSESYNGSSYFYHLSFISYE